MEPLYTVYVLFDDDICKDCRDYMFRNIETLKDAREPILGITAILICALLWHTGIIGHMPGIINWLWVFIYVLAYLGIEHIITEYWRIKIIKKLDKNSIDPQSLMTIEFFNTNMVVRLYSPDNTLIKEYYADYGNIKNVCKHNHYLFIELPEKQYFPYILPLDKNKADNGLTKELRSLKKKQYLYQR